MSDEQVNPKKFKLVKEEHDHFEVMHPDGSTFKVAKEPLDDKSHDFIRELNFDEGGSAPTAAEANAIENFTNEESSPDPGMQDSVQAPQSSGASFPKDESISQATVAPDIAAGGNSSTASQYGYPTPQDYDKLYSGMEAAGKKGLQAQEGEAQGEITASQNKVDTLNAANTWMNKVSEQQAMDDQSYEDQIKGFHLDPNRYWNSKSTGQKILGAISMAIGGYGSALSGQPNMAYGIIQRAINSDVESQKFDYNNMKTAYALNSQKYKNQYATHLATVNNSLSVANAMIDQAQAKAKGPLAEQQYQMLKNNIMVDRLNNRRDFSKYMLTTNPNAMQSDSGYGFPGNYNALGDPEITKRAVNLTNGNQALLNDPSQKKDFIEGQSAKNEWINSLTELNKAVEDYNPVTAAITKIPGAGNFSPATQNIINLQEAAAKAGLRAKDYTRNPTHDEVEKEMQRYAGPDLNKDVALTKNNQHLKEAYEDLNRHYAAYLPNYKSAQGYQKGKGQK